MQVSSLLVLVLLVSSLGSATTGCDGGADSGGGGGSLGGSVAAGGWQAIGGASGSGGDGDPGGATTAGARAACTGPGSYRNLFAEILQKPKDAVDEKIEAAVGQLFHGTGEQPIYYEMGSDQAYIKDVNNDDVRSEGVSYGMTIAVLMDMKTEFDKLWRFAQSRMLQSNGLFAWQLDTSGQVISPYAAPDGEEYFAMALMLASRRWGDAGTFDYGGEARRVMNAMLAPRPGGEFNSDPALVSFGPHQDFSDPSYVLPLFYSEWACFDTAHGSFWNQATTDGRTFFRDTTHPTTGLAPYQANWDGSARSGNGDFNADSWRVPMNVMMDHNLNRADPWQVTYAKRMAAFWVKEGLSSYGSGYTLSGTRTAEGHGAGLTAVNAMLAFGLPAEEGRPFLQAAWDVAVPTGQYRYYDGCLYLLAMLHLSGKFELFY